MHALCLSLSPTCVANSLAGRSDEPAAEQMREARQQQTALVDKLEKKRWKKDEVKAAFAKECEERFRSAFRQQQLQLQSQLQVLQPCM